MDPNIHVKSFIGMLFSLFRWKPKEYNYEKSINKMDVRFIIKLKIIILLGLMVGILFIPIVLIGIFGLKRLID